MCEVVLKYLLPAVGFFKVRRLIIPLEIICITYYVDKTNTTFWITLFGQEGRRGIVVFITAYGAKGRRFESRSFLFFRREQPVSPIAMHSRNVRRPRENKKSSNCESRNVKTRERRDQDEEPAGERGKRT